MLGSLQLVRFISLPTISLYEKPGFLYTPEDVLETRWLTFPAVFDAKHPNFTSSDIPYDALPPSEILEDSPPQYMKQVVEKNFTGLDWLRHRNILIIGTVCFSVVAHT